MCARYMADSMAGTVANIDGQEFLATALARLSSRTRTQSSSLGLEPLAGLRLEEPYTDHNLGLAR